MSYFFGTIHFLIFLFFPRTTHFFGLIILLQWFIAQKEILQKNYLVVELLMYYQTLPRIVSQHHSEIG